MLINFKGKFAYVANNWVQQISLKYDYVTLLLYGLLIYFSWI
jgi:hypothetical protein